ncbi:MAG: ComEA family DNA-binding protein [Candidatus Hydrogenedentes bacterium]|nr:ComEA family DNA-binding protein [Candidatus Hydrogenedentota bacterium]
MQHKWGCGTPGALGARAMLSRLLTTKEQFVLVVVAAAVCVGGIAVYLSRPPEERVPPGNGSGVREVVIREQVFQPVPPPESPAIPDPEPVPATATVALPRQVSVAIAGAVTRPGVYTLRSGSCVADLIEEAGGGLEYADLRDINLAAGLIHGTTLTIPSGPHASKEGGRLVVRGAPAVRVTNPPEYTISGWRPAEPRPGPGASSSTASSTSGTQDDGRIDLNLATAEQLETLPGIGPKKAQEIISYRQGQPFRTVDELTNVKGIGPKTLETLRPHVKVETPITQ